MTGTEMQILRIVAEEGRCDPASAARSMGVSANFLAPVMERLVEGGHLKEANGGAYTITTKGEKALAPFAGRGNGSVAVSKFP